MRPVNEIKKLPPMSEAQFAREFETLADLYGWLWYHAPPFTRQSKAPNPGFPDYVLLRPQTKEILFVELKKEKGKVKKAQMLWLIGLNHVRSDSAFVLRPSQLKQAVAILKWPEAE